MNCTLSLSTVLSGERFTDPDGKEHKGPGLARGCGRLKQTKDTRVNPLTTWLTPPPRSVSGEPHSPLSGRLLPLFRDVEPECGCPVKPCGMHFADNCGPPRHDLLAM